MKKLGLFCAVVMSIFTFAGCNQPETSNISEEDYVLFPALNGDKYGYIDTSGNIVINPQFDFAEAFSEGTAKVEIEERWAYIDKSGKIVYSEE